MGVDDTGVVPLEALADETGSTFSAAPVLLTRLLFTFSNGAFCNDAFCNGAFCNGAFCNGAFCNGAFCRGTFWRAGECCWRRRLEGRVITTREGGALAGGGVGVVGGVGGVGGGGG